MLADVTLSFSGLKYFFECVRTSSSFASFSGGGRNCTPSLADR
jgi:hypothetical protein